MLVKFKIATQDNPLKEKTMQVAISALAVALAAIGISLPAAANDDLRFKGGIGVDPVAGIQSVNIPVSSGAPLNLNVPISNIVRGVPPGGRAWVIKSLEARITRSGNISVEGEGLLLAGGDGIGTIGAVTRVVATLFCGEPATATASNSPPARLKANGDFEIYGKLDFNPSGRCVQPVLLIRNVNAQGDPTAWFAAGIPDD